MAPEEQRHLAAIERFVGRAIPRVLLPDFDYNLKPNQLKQVAIYDDERVREKRADMRNAGFLNKPAPSPPSSGHRTRLTQLAAAKPRIAPISVVAKLKPKSITVKVGPAKVPAKPILKPLPKPIAKPVYKPLVKPLPKPVVKPGPKLFVRPLVKPLVKPFSKMVAKKPAAKPASKPKR